MTLRLKTQYVTSWDSLGVESESLPLTCTPKVLLSMALKPLLLQWIFLIANCRYLWFYYFL